MARLCSMALYEWTYLLAAILFLLLAAGFQAIIPKVTGQVLYCKRDLLVQLSPRLLARCCTHTHTHTHTHTRSHIHTHTRECM